MNCFKLFIVLAVIGAAWCDQYSSVLKAIDAMIAKEEQRQHALSHLNGEEHQHNTPLPHDIAYSPEYSAKDLTDGVAYAEALRGAGKPTLPVFTAGDRSTFEHVDIPASSQLTDQEKLHQTLLSQEPLLNNQQKDQQVKRNALNSLIEEEDRLQNPLHGLPTFTSNETVADFVAVCTPDMQNGIPCPGGRCFNGKCKPDQACYDDCCDADATAQSGRTPKPNGTPCRGGNCLQGRCRSFPACVGECCADERRSIAKPNGTPCEQGHCYEGGCVSDVGCASGACCNSHTGRLFPKGFPCHVSDCQQKSFCTGLSAFCPETAPKEDGAVCVGGTCSKGVCAKTGVVSTTTAVCTSGPCCDGTTHAFLPAGTSCTNSPCMTGGVCTGFSSECTASSEPVADGTACPNGRCKEGQCIAVATCNPDDECCDKGVSKKDYTVCNHGRCFGGACVFDGKCAGECCKSNDGKGNLQAQPNGYPCNNGTQVCQAGQCVSAPLCVGECCDQTGPAADGKACGTSGKCAGGLCVEESAKCAEGVCCNEQTGYLRPKGFPCRASPCTEEMMCTGTSAFCPTSLKHKEDGTPCPDGGKCYGGKCVLPPKDLPQCTDGPCCDTTTLKFKPAGVICGNATCQETTYCTGSSQYCPVSLNTLPDGTVCKLTDRAATDWKCKAGVCVEPAPLAVDETVDVDLTRNECNTDSPCCNLSIHRVRPRGFVCSVAQNACMRDTVCDGETAACTPHVLEDGAACPGGSCVHGFCVKGIDPTDQDAVHEVHIHVVPKEQRELSPEEAAMRAIADDEDGEDSEDEDSKEELMTIITTEADGKVTERSVRLPLNALERAKAKSLQMGAAATDKNDKKAKTREEQVEAAARALIEAERNKNATETVENAETAALNSTLALNSTVALNTTSPLQQNATETEEASAAQQSSSGEELSDTLKAFSAAYPMPTVGSVDPLTGSVRLVSTAASNRCAEGECCDTSNGVFFPRGFQCAVPKNLCQVAACSGYSTVCYTIDRPNGAVCPGGKCFEGECISDCVGECCDHHNEPRPNGVKCGENGYCFEGTCVSKCEGECCNEHGFAKEDGAGCTLGFCLEGKCLQTRDNMDADAAAEAVAEGMTPEQALKAVPTLRRTAPRNMEEEWNQMLRREAAEKHEAKLRAVREENEERARQEKVDAARKSADSVVLKEASLQAAHSKKDAKLVKWILIGGGCGVAVLAVVALIAVAVAKSRKRKAQEQNDFYEKF